MPPQVPGYSCFISEKAIRLHRIPLSTELSTHHVAGGTINKGQQIDVTTKIQ